MSKRATAIIIQNGAVLLMRRQKPGKNYCILPGGGVELEESFEEACIREIKEETGLDVTSLRQVRVYFSSAGQEAYFLASVEPGEPVLGGVEARRHSPLNQYSFEWATVDEFDEKNLLPLVARRICGEVLGKFT